MFKFFRRKKSPLGISACRRHSFKETRSGNFMFCTKCGVVLKINRD